MCSVRQAPINLLVPCTSFKFGCRSVRVLKTLRPVKKLAVQSKVGDDEPAVGLATAKVSDLEQELLQNRLINGTTPVPKVPIEIINSPSVNASGSVTDSRTALCGVSNFIALTPTTLTTFPYYAMCKLYMTWLDTNQVNWRYIGSGFAVDANTVVTASHCVFDYDKRDWPNKGWADAVEVFPAMYGPKISLVGSPRNAVKYAAFKGWTEVQYPQSLPWDGAIFRVDGDLGLSRYLEIEQGPDKPTTTMDVTLLGYPGCMQRGDYPYATLDRMEIGLDQGNTYEHYVDICGGNSGGPALERSNSKAFAINVAERLQIVNGQRIPVCPNTSTALGYNIKIDTLKGVL